MRYGWQGAGQGNGGYDVLYSGGWGLLGIV